MKENIDPSEKTSGETKDQLNRTQRMYLFIAIALSLVFIMGMYVITTQELSQSAQGPLFLFSLFLLIAIVGSIYKYSTLSNGTEGMFKQVVNKQVTKLLASCISHYQKNVDELKLYHSTSNTTNEMKENFLNKINSYIQELRSLESRISTEWSGDIPKDRLSDIQKTVEYHIVQGGQIQVDVKRFISSSQ